MKVIAFALFLVVGAACSPSDSPPDWPDLSTLYEVQGVNVACADPAGQSIGEVEAYCSWKNVLVNGAPHCYAIVYFERVSIEAEWSVARTYASAASCD